MTYDIQEDVCRLHSNTTAFYIKNLGIAILVSPRSPEINRQRVQRMTVYRRPLFCFVYLAKIKFKCLMINRVVIQREPL